MNFHNSSDYVSCESEFDRISVPLAKKVDADVYVIDSDKLEGAPELERTVTRLCGISEESWDYSGVLYTNCFRANKPIMLTSLGFFGPDLPEEFVGSVAYEVNVHVEELMATSHYDYGTSIKVAVNISRREPIFYVNIPVPVNVIPNVWYTIKFKLQGPQTLRGINQVDNVLSSDGVTFQFFQGSLQMPALKYKT